ncbi:MAG TPA: MFS transporter [Pyrinomonadaceae bacterium]|nr:MFS transporter [Pyrinomonadaceae bacterium]
MGTGETDTDAGDEFDALAGALPTREAPGLTVERPARLWHRLGRLPRNVFAIGLVSLLNDSSSEIIYPLLPAFLAITLGASPKAIGIVEGLAESVSSLLKLFSGYFSDRTGRRKAPVVFGYGVASVVRPLLGLATNWYQVLAVRFTDRVGKGVRTAPRDAMIADAAPAAERGLAFGFHRAMDNAGAVLGPLIGLAALELLASDANTPTALDYKTIFLLASVPALAAMVVMIFAVRETHPGQAATKAGAVKTQATSAAAANIDARATNVEALSPDEIEATKKPRLSLRGFDANFKWFLVLVAVFTLSNSTDAFLIRRAQQAGVSTGRGTLLLWAALHISKVASSIIGGDLSDRLGRKTLIVSGWTLYAGVYLCFAFVSTSAAAWALFLIYGIYFGLCEGTEKALVADLVRPHQRGTAFGLYNLAFGVTVLPASLLMGALWDWRGPATAFVVSACIGSTAALLLALSVRARPPRSAR